MAETIEKRNGVMVWTWKNIQNDINRTGLAQVEMDSMSVLRNKVCGKTVTGMDFSITWIHQVILILSMPEENDGLVQALCRVLECAKPTCRYNLADEDVGSDVTFEWHGTMVGEDLLQMHFRDKHITNLQIL